MCSPPTMASQTPRHKIGSFDYRTYIIKPSRNYRHHPHQPHQIRRPRFLMQQPCASYSQTSKRSPPETEAHQGLIEELKDLQASRRWKQSSAASRTTGPSTQHLKEAESLVSQLVSSTEDFYLGPVSVSPVWDSQTSIGDTAVQYVPLAVVGYNIQGLYPVAQCPLSGPPCASVCQVSASATSQAATCIPSMSLCGANDTSGGDEGDGKYEASGEDQSTLQSLSWMPRLCVYVLLMVTSFIAGSAAMAMINVNKDAAPSANIFSGLYQQPREINSRTRRATATEHFAAKPSIQDRPLPRYFDAAREAPRHQWDAGAGRMEYESTDQISKVDPSIGSAADLGEYTVEERGEDSFNAPGREKPPTQHQSGSSRIPGHARQERNATRRKLPASEHPPELQ